MAALRTWVYQTMMGAPAITGLVGDRIFQGESMSKAPDTKPFIIYRFGNTSPDNRVKEARRQYCTIYCHDMARPGDYLRVDDMVKAVVDTLTAAPPAPAYDLLEARWLETSADFDDREMGTILRYIRFHLVTSSWWT